MIPQFNIAYDTPRGTKLYCRDEMPLAKAKELLSSFKARYLNADGTSKAFPNGQGHYDISNGVLKPCAS
jgi:hypothetical protein